EEPAWGESVEVPWCDTSVAGCVYTEGPWREMAKGAYCDVNDSARCSAGSWEILFLKSCSPVDGITCRKEKLGPFDVFSTRTFRQKSVVYAQRQQAGSVEICETVGERCTDTRKIVDGNSYISPLNKKNQCETNHIILFTD